MIQSAIIIGLLSAYFIYKLMVPKEVNQNKEDKEENQEKTKFEHFLNKYWFHIGVTVIISLKLLSVGVNNVELNVPPETPPPVEEVVVLSW